MVEEEFVEETSGEMLGGEAESGEGEVEEISVNVQMLEVMLERLGVLEKLAKGEISEEEARQMLGSIAVPELEKKRRRRRK